MVHAVGTQHEEEGKVWCRLCHESWSLVSLCLKLQAHNRLTHYSASATAIVKCTKLSANSTSTDPTYDVGELLLWAGAENALILTAASVPTLRPLLRAVFPTTVRSSENSHPLKNISNNFNVFTPKNKAGQWSAIIETEVHHDQTSDNNSDRSILEHGAAGAQKSGSTHDQGAGPSRPAHIKKTTEFNVSYD